MTFEKTSQKPNSHRTRAMINPNLKIVEQVTDTYMPICHELDDVGLAEAKEMFFPNNVPISPMEHARYGKAFYSTLKLDERGDLWGDIDRGLLGVSIKRAMRHLTKPRSCSLPPTRRLLVIGGGDGRLAKVLLELACANKITEICFNDLYADQVDVARNRFEALRPEQYGVKITYLSGDFSTLQLDGLFDIALALFFVTSEILDLQSSKALRQRRAEFYLSVRRALHPSGVFIEDIPETGLAGIYNEICRKTANLLRDVPELMDDRSSFALTYIRKPDGGFPYYIRYLPSPERHYDELASVGFVLVGSWNEQALQKPNEDDVGNLQMRRLKRLELWVPSYN